MELIDFLIEATTLASAAYLGVVFIAGLGKRRVSAAADAPQPDVPAAELHPSIADSVVPFRRSVRPAVVMPTDRELIALAKSTGYPGAKKWSYNRKLTQKTKVDLLNAWQSAS